MGAALLPMMMGLVGGGAASAGKGGKGGGGGTTPATDLLMKIAGDTFAMSKPGLQTSLNALQEMLTTGGMQARQPVYGKAVEASQRAGSQAQSQTAEQLARTGLAGTPFGERTMADTAQQSAYQTSQIVPGMMNEDYFKTLTMLVPLLTGVQSSSLAGMGQASGAQAGMEAASIARTPNATDYLDILGKMLMG